MLEAIEYLFASLILALFTACVYTTLYEIVENEEPVVEECENNVGSVITESSEVIYNNETGMLSILLPDFNKNNSKCLCEHNNN